MSHNGPPPAIQPVAVIHVAPGERLSFLQTPMSVPKCAYCGRCLHSYHERCPGCGAAVWAFTTEKSA
jgi:hypothetical protein